MPEQRSPAGDALTELLLKVFRLNGRFLDVAERITAGTGLTAARWQVLGAVLAAPLSVAGIARSMGLSRQSVQRLADALVADEFCEYRQNPTHRRAKLLAPAAGGWATIALIRPIQHDWANRVAQAVGERQLCAAVRTADAILAALDSPSTQVRRKSAPPRARKAAARR